MHHYIWPNGQKCSSTLKKKKKKVKYRKTHCLPQFILHGLYWNVVEMLLMGSRVNKYCKINVLRRQGGLLIITDQKKSIKIKILNDNDTSKGFYIAITSWQKCTDWKKKINIEKHFAYLSLLLELNFTVEHDGKVASTASTLIG